MNDVIRFQNEARGRAGVSIRLLAWMAGAYSTMFFIPTRRHVRGMCTVAFAERANLLDI